MFGILERSRLAMFHSTLKQAERDATSDQLDQMLSLTLGMQLLGLAVDGASGSQAAMKWGPDLRTTIALIPSGLLAPVDTILLRVNKPALSSEDQSEYQVITLINGLVFVRIVEVSRPSLTTRAHMLREAILSFVEPTFAMVMRNVSATENPYSSSAPLRSIKTW